MYLLALEKTAFIKLFSHLVKEEFSLLEEMFEDGWVRLRTMLY